MSAAAGRHVWAALELLDRQLIDCDGIRCGKVDDLRFDLPDAPDALPVLMSIATGPAALGHRIGGRFGRWLEAIMRRLNERDPVPGDIGMGVVKHIGTNLNLTVSRDDIPSSGLESWLARAVIGKIPGARRTASDGGQKRHEREIG